MVERWQKDADGILIFVRPYVPHSYFFHLNRNTIDWFVLCRSRCPPCRYHPGFEAEQPGHLRILPCQHLSATRRPECNALIHSSP